MTTRPDLAAAVSGLPGRRSFPGARVRCAAHPRPDPVLRRRSNGFYLRTTPHNPSSRAFRVHGKKMPATPVPVAFVGQDSGDRFASATSRGAALRPARDALTRAASRSGSE